MDTGGINQKSEKLFQEYPVSKWHGKASEYLLNLKKTHQKIAVACSGGADSVFALSLCYSIFSDSIHVIHVNHSLRGKESERDAKFVEQLSVSLELEFSCLGIEEKNKLDEGTIREARLSALLSKLNSLSIKTLVQGHQLDDVAESFLWRISRGAGPLGLCSPRPLQVYKSAVFVRPFLTIRKSEIKKSLDCLKIPWVEDKSNASPEFLRNRIRKNTISSWKKEVDRDLLSGVQRSRDLIEEQNQAIESMADQSKMSLRPNNTVRMVAFKKYPRAVQRLLIYRMLGEIGYAVSQEEASKLLNSVERNKTRILALSKNFFLHLSTTELSVRKLNSDSAGSFSPHSLPDFGTLYFPGSKKIDYRRIAMDDEISEILKKKKINPNQEAFLDANTFPSRKVIVRKRENGDRYRPLGLKSPKKLKDLLIDRKWSNERKESTPVFHDSNSEIIWIPGFGPCDHKKISSSTEWVIRLTYNHSSS